METAGRRDCEQTQRDDKEDGYPHGGWGIWKKMRKLIYNQYEHSTVPVFAYGTENVTEAKKYP